MTTGTTPTKGKINFAAKGKKKVSTNDNKDHPHQGKNKLSPKSDYMALKIFFFPLYYIRKILGFQGGGGKCPLLPLRAGAHVIDRSY